jgi:cobalamin biosynthesis protein CbiG
MTAHAFIINQRAVSMDDMQLVFHNIDAKRLDYLAEALADADRPFIAELARKWAAEHRMVADRLSGAVPIGAGEDDAEITASAIAFGGPLPVKVSA